MTALLTDSGRVEDAIAWLRRCAEVGDDRCWGDLGDLFRDAGRITEAVDAYRRAMDGGDRTALWRLARTFEDEGRINDAVALLLSCGEVEARFTARKLLGERPEADRLQNYGIEPDGRIAQPWEAPRVDTQPDRVRRSHDHSPS